MPPDGRMPLEILIALSNLALAAGLVLNAQRKHSLPQAIPFWCYLLLQAASSLASALQGPGQPSKANALALTAEYLAVISPIALLAATLIFVRAQRRGWLLMIPLVALAAAALALNARISGPRGGVAEGVLRPAASALACFGALALSIVIAWRTRIGSHSPLHRNRLRYWIAALLLVALGALMMLALRQQVVLVLAGGGVTLIGSGLAVITWSFYYLPDIRVALRRGLSYGVLTLVTFIIYLAGIRLAQLAFPAASGQGPLIGAVLVASVLAVGYAPLRNGVQTLTRRLLKSETADYAASLKDYSEHITHVLELEPLANIAVETLRKTLGASSGALFLVEDDADGRLTLKAIDGSTMAANESLTCPPTSPIAQQWRSGSGALRQYDVDVLPAFRGVSAAERATLARWKMEILLPIRTMGQLVGVLAVGSKRSRDPYFDGDMAYLATLADETGVALQNARLFSDLRDASQQTENLNRTLAQANEQLKELDKLKSAFIGVITHELRSPFAALDFSMQLIQKYGLDNLLPEQREQLEQLSEGLKRAQTMINNLITFASLLSKQGQMCMVPVDLKQIARETVTTLEPMARKKEVTLKLDLPAVIPTVAGDRDRLSEAVYHLVHNAIKFNRQGGSVNLACRCTPEQVTVTVSDTGVGIAPEKLNEVWKDFTQVADPLRRGVEGLGLGLPLVQYVVKAHNGDVWARSEPGEGSMFGFTLPLPRPAK